jgi:hypothetical protein
MRRCISGGQIPRSDHGHQAVPFRPTARCRSAPYPFPSLHQHIRRVVDAYDPQRVFWGTDRTRLSCPYRQAVTLFTEELEFLSDEDRERIMGRGIAEWLGWPLPRN